jgi:DNA-binding transcriptional regulator YdaS (Cro superfamily)
MVNEVNFNLEGLNQAFSLDVSGALAGEVPATIDASCIAIFNVKTSDMKNVFKYESDSFDVNDTDASDIKYYVYMNAWPATLKLNPVHAHTLSTTPMLETAGEVLAEKNLVKHDFVRYLAKSLFNTPHGVDLFSNEDALLTDLVQKGAVARLAIDASLNAVNQAAAALSGTAPHKYSTNATATAANFSRALLRQVANVRPARFHGISDISGVHSIPFVDGDTISFKVAIAPAALQHNLTLQAGPFNTRVYKIQLNLVADADSPVGNVIPGESDTVGGVAATYVSASEYPYHSA